ncbi:PREDICTED: F-box protein DOR-like [Brassica oleracea var. oleracea]|uniref:F-box protein DOR-like n=1 Tax=Brassica oleracea var. oleracea TaxID=109376 RepID=UPI0006A71720|nr:PREDICTED: F-box protein DOR-like [Brassica oleracea var. oleracea]
MESRRRNVAGDPKTISKPLDAEEFSSMIPIELTIEIFSRLPLKSIARCRCVSKHWASILLRPDFTDLFFTKSLARPKLLFALPKVCFDVRSEKYSFVKPPEGGMFKLINFQVLSPRFPSYLYYYNFVSEDISRVEIQGIEAFKKDSEAHVILNHVEDAKIMELF